MTQQAKGENRMAWTLEKIERYEQLMNLETLTEQEVDEIDSLQECYLAFERYIWGVETA